VNIVKYGALMREIGFHFSGDRYDWQWVIIIHGAIFTLKLSVIGDCQLQALPRP
jgi:hypothetical protein